MTKFETGKTYATRSICDHNCIFSFMIERRTAKSVWVKVYNKVRRRTIFIHDDVERFMPFGRYSMAATISADKEVR